MVLDLIYTITQSIKVNILIIKDMVKVWQLTKMVQVIKVNILMTRNMEKESLSMQMEISIEVILKTVKDRVKVHWII